MWTAERIRQLRDAYDENQEDFASRLGVSVWTLRDWEQGRARAHGCAEKLFERLEEDLKSPGGKRQLQSA